MKLKLIPELSYRVETENGEPLGVFTKGEEWKGMTELVNGMNVLIVNSPHWVDSFFSFGEQEERVAELVKGEGMIYEQLRKVEDGEK